MYFFLLCLLCFFKIVRILTIHCVHIIDFFIFKLNSAYIFLVVTGYLKLNLVSLTVAPTQLPSLFESH